MATCWGFMKDHSGAYNNRNRSYLVDLNQIDQGSKLSAHENVGSYATPGFNGSWMCSKIFESPVEETDSAVCLRFLPKESFANMVDGRFGKGAVKVVTYLEGRMEMDQLSREVEAEVAALRESGEGVLRQKKMEAGNRYSG